MPLSCHLRILLARLNLERARQGLPAITLRCLARDSGVSLSAVVALHTGRSQRIDYVTVDRLLSYFSHAMPVGVNDLLAWVPPQSSEAPVARA